MLSEDRSFDKTAIESLAESFEKIAHALGENKPKVEVINQPVQGLGKILEVLARTIEETIFPIMRTMDKKLSIGQRPRHFERP